MKLQRKPAITIRTNLTFISPYIYVSNILFIIVHRLLSDLTTGTYRLGKIHVCLQAHLTM